MSHGCIGSVTVNIVLQHTWLDGEKENICGELTTSARCDMRMCTSHEMADVRSTKTGDKQQPLPESADVHKDYTVSY